MFHIKKFVCIIFALVLTLSTTSCDVLNDMLMSMESDMADTEAEKDTKNTDSFNTDITDDLKDPFEDSNEEADQEEDSNEVEDHVHIESILEEVAPTCTEDGLTEGIECKRCGEILVAQQRIASLGHDFKIWKIKAYADQNNWGIKEKKCNTCGMIAESLIHASEGLEYADNGDGTCYVKGLGTCKDREIVIPMTYEGNSVTGIGDGAFESCAEIDAVILPEGIKSIGPSAFSWCDSLAFINIPDNVTSIGDSAFWYCFNISEISIPDGINYIGEGALSCTGLSSITIDKENQFYRVEGNCVIERKTGRLILGFNDSVIPNDQSVTEIARDAFAGCGGLKNIVIPEGVRSIGDSAFYCCGELVSITFPESLETIGYNAFNACHSLRTVKTPKSLTEICDSAFVWCSGIETVIIGDGVSYIGSNAFSQCSSLKDIYYTGTEAEWNNIDKEKDWDFSAGKYNVHYNYVY